MADLYDILLGQDPAAAEDAATTIAKALKRDRAAGLLAAMSGNKLLQPVGGALMSGADRQSDRLARAQAARAQTVADRIEAAGRAAAEGRRQAFTAEQNKLDRAAARERAQMMADATRAQRLEAGVERDVQKLGQELEPVTKMRGDLGTLQGYAAQDDQPGFGPIAGRLPDVLTSGEGIDARQAAGRIMAGIIQMVSGQAASEKEVARHLEARGLGKTATPAAFKQGVAALEREFAEAVRQREARFRPEVVQTYGARGGATSATMKPPAVERMRQLKAQGLSKEQAVATMEREGY